MTEDEIKRALREAQPTACSDPVDDNAWQLFCERMQKRDYPPEALTIAWAWYQTGWDDSSANAIASAASSRHE